MSIHRIDRELRPLRDVTMNALGHDLAGAPPHPVGAEIVDALKRKVRKSAEHWKRHESGQNGEAHAEEHAVSAGPGRLQNGLYRPQQDHEVVEQ